jgi:hypothetical protein
MPILFIFWRFSGMDYSCKVKKSLRKASYEITEAKNNQKYYGSLILLYIAV